MSKLEQAAARVLEGLDRLYEGNLSFSDIAPLREELRGALSPSGGTVKVVINDEYGGFSLSYGGVLRYCELAGIEVWPEEDKEYPTLDPNYWLVGPDAGRVNISVSSEDWIAMPLDQRAEHNALCDQQLFQPRGIARDDPHLVQTVEELGQEAAGRYAHLRVVEIPAGVDWQISEYDGSEWISEVHRTWR